MECRGVDITGGVCGCAAPVESLCVQIAGLCHDLGHGPMSHMFDRHFIPRCRGPSCTWEHEAASAAMLDRLIADNPGMRAFFSKHGLGAKEIHLIKVCTVPITRLRSYTPPRQRHS